MEFSSALDPLSNFEWDGYDPSWEYISNFFNEDETQRIRELKRDYAFDRAVTVGKTSESTDSEIRESKTFWIDQNEDTKWIYDRISWHVQKVNERKWRYYLTGLNQIQYTRYEGSEQVSLESKLGLRTHRNENETVNGHYEWHIDGGKRVANRKISVAIQLSDSDSYEGGNFLTRFSDGDIVHGRTAGTGVIFPSYILHKVEPITSGIRESLVCWVMGPTFR